MRGLLACLPARATTPEAVEELKYAGQPGNESSRMRQYITLTMKAWENLRYIKRDRTPVATRAFARVYIFLHPFFWYGLAGIMPSTSRLRRIDSRSHEGV